MNQQQSQAAFAAYRSSAQGTTGLSRTVMLYDQLSARLREARAEWEAGTFDAAFEAVKEAASILTVLSASLDDSRGGALCTTLRRYYRGLSFQILAVPRQKDPLSRIDSLLSQVKEVRDAWAVVLAQGVSPPAQSATAHKEANGAGLA